MPATGRSDRWANLAVALGELRETTNRAYPSYPGEADSYVVDNEIQKAVAAQPNHRRLREHAPAGAEPSPSTETAPPTRNEFSTVISTELPVAPRS